MKELIARGLKAAGSKAKLAKELGISAPNITYYESQSTPSVQTLEKLVRYLGGNLPVAAGASTESARLSEANLVREADARYGEQKSQRSDRCGLREGREYRMKLVRLQRNGNFILEVGEAG